jgi:predicted nucleotidyltransferase
MSLRVHLADVKKRFGVKKIGVFGSHSRAEETNASDVDVLVGFQKPVDIFTFLELKEFLETVLKRKVEQISLQENVCYRAGQIGLHSFFVPYFSRNFRCDVEQFKHAKRLSRTEKEIRDLLLYGIWRTSQFKNEQISDLFGMSYSGVSHAVRSVKLKPAKSRQLQTEFDLLNSLFKL